MTMRRAKRCQNSAALLIFMRRTNPFEPFEPIEPAEPLSRAIKGGKKTPRGLTPNLFFQPESLPERFPAVFLLDTVHGFGGTSALFLFV